MDSLPIIRIWAAAAWADGKLHAAEAASLRRLIDSSDDLDADARKLALGMLDGPPELDVAEIRALPRSAREGAYRAALAIVRLDRKVTDDERAFLERLRPALDLDEETLRRIDKQWEGR
jgi:uncharacterized membrane protein YebE (DUF533 family)